jgi:protein-arginine kinase activator protein McsA
MAKTYYEKLKDPRWQKKRLEVFERDNFKCTQCGNPKDTLAVHHGYYSKLDPWEYRMDTLHTVCDSCHEQFESIKHDLHLEIGKLSVLDMYKVFDFVRDMEVGKKGRVKKVKVSNKVNIKTTVIVPKLDNAKDLLSEEDYREITNYCCINYPDKYELDEFLDSNFPLILSEKRHSAHLFNENIKNG